MIVLAAAQHSQSGNRPAPTGSQWARYRQTGRPVSNRPVHRADRFKTAGPARIEPKPI